MKRVTFAIISLLMAGAVGHARAEGLQSKAEQLAADPVFNQASVGICVRDAAGKTLAEVDAGRMLVPASNMKLISTGAALHQLGPDYRFATGIGYSGEIADGVLHGDLYIIGGGDPTLGSKDSIAVNIEKTFAQWEAMIRKAGIRKIEGHIVGDGRWLDGMAEEPTWLWNDIGTYYGTGVTGLMFYENMQSFSVGPGGQEGAPVDIAPYYPDCPWMEFRYDCTTGAEGTGDRLYMYTSDLAPVAEIRGTFGVDRGRKRVDCSNKYPEYTCAVYFGKYLERRGIRCTEGAADMKLKRFNPSSDLTLLGKTLSPSLARIVFETNHASNNLFAETLLRTLGKELHGSSCYDSSYVALDDVMKSLKVDFSRGAHIQDGSGLSRQNYVSADFFCRFLTGMMASPHFNEFLCSLPIPGGNGSLSYNMKRYPPAMRSRIRVKSGSMNGVRCYSGYVLPEGFIPEPGKVIPEEIRRKIVIFSVMTSNCTSPNWKVRPMLDRFMADITVSD